MKKKTVLLIIISTVILWSFYAYQIRLISKLEKKNLVLKKEINNLKQKQDKSLYKYDLETDLKKIEKEMIKKKNMTVSEKIIFFKIDDNSF